MRSFFCADGESKIAHPVAVRRIDVYGVEVEEIGVGIRAGEACPAITVSSSASQGAEFDNDISAPHIV